MLDGDRLLDLCQQGAGKSPLAKAALIGELVAGSTARTLPLGELDRRIWKFRAGHRLESGLPVAAAVCHCPECGARLEFSLPADFALPPANADRAGVAFGGREYLLRMPTLGDFGAQGLQPERLGDGRWEADAFAALAGEALQAADPALAFGVALSCPDCGHGFAESFDPAGFFFAELEEEGRDLLDDIVRLAGAFHWSERDIMALPAARRALYLARIGE